MIDLENAANEAANVTIADEIIENASVETETAAAELDKTAEEVGEPDAEGKPKKNRATAAERIKQLTSDKYGEKARADEAVRKLKDAEAKLARYQGVKAPNVDEFSSDEEFETAKARHDVAKTRRVEAEMDIEDARKDVTVAIEAAWDVRTANFKKSAPDFDEVVAVIGTKIDPSKALLIKESDLGPEVAYYIATTPDEAQKFISADPISAARQLGRIEAHLSLKPGKKISNAPPPVDTLGGSQGSGSPDLSKLPYDQYRKAAGYD